MPLQLFELRSPFCKILTPILISTFAHLSKTKQKPSTLHSLRFLSVCRRQALSLISCLLEKNNTRPCGQAGRATGPGETEARGRHRGARALTEGQGFAGLGVRSHHLALEGLRHSRVGCKGRSGPSLRARGPGGVLRAHRAGGSAVKNPLPTPGTQVRSPVWQDPRAAEQLSP